MLNHSPKRNALTLTAFGVAVLASCSAAHAQESADRVPRHRSATINRALTQLQSIHAHDAVDVHGVCVSFPEFSVMFDGELTASEFLSYADGLGTDELDAAAEEFGAYQAQGSVWISTATNGAVATGQAFTLRYSFVPDGTSILVAGYGSAAPCNLTATMNAAFPGGFAAFKTRVRAMFDRFEELTNITYVEVADDGAAFPSSAGLLAATGVTGRGDVRIGMRSLDGANGTNAAAVNFYPQFGGDMVLDADNMTTFTNSGGDFVVLRNILAHEHGHGLGLAHVIPVESKKLMEPLASSAFDGPQEDDIRGITRLYGDQHEPNEAYPDDSFVGGTLNTVQNAGVQLFTVEDVALERNGSKDFYSFTAFANVPIAIRVSPIGTTYQQGPENGTAASVNGKSIRNLALRLWRRVSATTGELAMVAQIDFNATGQDEYHPPIPYSVAGYMLAEVYSNDTTNDSQRYTLQISNAAINPIVDPPSMSVFDLTTFAQVNNDDTILFASTQIGQNLGRTLRINNGGPGALQIGTITIAGPGAADYTFSLIGGSNVAAGAFSSLALSFAPTAVGQRVAVLTIPSNDPTFPNFACILSGTATAAPAPQMQVKAGNVNIVHGNTYGGNVFPPGVAGTPQTVPFTIQNNGNANLIVTPPVVISGTHAANYSVQLDKTVIPPGAAAAGTLNITLDVPANEGGGLYVGQFTINSNDPTRPAFSFTVSATVALLDCNSNGVADPLDIAGGTSTDCNTNATPDDCEIDGDGDGVIDVCDGCPEDPQKTDPGVCGCGVADADSDGDGTPDCNDLCPLDPNKTAPGACDCGTDDVDSDGDGTPDCNDLCPLDGGKTAPGACDCGTADTDADGTPDCLDGCPDNADKTQPNECACAVDPCAGEGACCLADGTCAVSSFAACIASGGNYRGDGTTCEAADICPPVVNDGNTNGMDGANTDGNGNEDVEPAGQPGDELGGNDPCGSGMCGMGTTMFSPLMLVGLRGLRTASRRRIRMRQCLVRRDQA